MRRVVMVLVMTGRFQGPAQNKRRKTEGRERVGNEDDVGGQEPDDREHAGGALGSKRAGWRGRVWADELTWASEHARRGGSRAGAATAAVGRRHR
jgi:hypothetical protein